MNLNFNFFPRHALESVVLDSSHHEDFAPAVTEKELTQEQIEMLNVYHRTFNDELVDHNLVASVIRYIQEEISDEGSILVFLPGYEDITTMRYHFEVK